jgi:hypothetical protein
MSCRCNSARRRQLTGIHFDVARRANGALNCSFRLLARDANLLTAQS